MSGGKIIIAFLLLLSWVSPARAQSELEYLKKWVGNNPISTPGEPRRNLYKTPRLRRKLVRLLGRKNYNRLLNDYYVMGPVRLAGDYVTVSRCERHNCDESSNFMAVNTATGAVHVAFYKSGALEWFHTRGRSRDLPREVLNDEWFRVYGPFTRSISETARGAT